MDMHILLDVSYLGADECGSVCKGETWMDDSIIKIRCSEMLHICIDYVYS